MTMLRRLIISNYALIDWLEMTWDSGLTIITGETGAGKSIIIGALSLILGERCDSKAIRDPEKKTMVEASFDIEGFGLESFFSENDLDYFEHECIIRREIAVGGRSRAFVNDLPVNITVLKDLATHLVDIHSQHSNMLLAKPQFQLDVIDSLAGNLPLRKAYDTCYAELRAAEKQLKQLQEDYAQSHAEQDYLQFQLGQLIEIKLAENEDTELENLQQRLSNVATLKEALWTVKETMNGDEQSLLSHLNTVAARLEGTVDALPEVADLARRVREAAIELKDVTLTVSGIEDDLVDDPAELERVNDRLNAIYALERKHSVNSVNDLLAIQQKLQAQLDAINSSDDTIAALQAQVDDARRKAQSLAEELSATRKQVAQEFAHKMKMLAQPLGMKNIEFEVACSTVPLNANGCDSLEFRVAFNKNQSTMPIKDTASGGEISRVMLCIKAIVAQAVQLPTIIFDEVDTGVSGDVANMVGEMMGDIAHTIQVITITHLPQVAAHGMHHKKVFKTDTALGTVTGVVDLDDDEHMMEIARMLSGKDLNEAAIANAKALISTSRKS